ncbi:hypothetical protein [Staphylococcus shinii]|uniref:hypothetical protein n=1 Tax=Staphylococcus shinii TaxID=2912228 RepID=UPI003EE8CA4B
MNIINDLLDWLNDESVNSGLKVVALLGGVGMVITLCGAIVVSFTGKFARAGKWLAAFAVIAILMGSGYTVMKTISTGTGEDIDNQVNMLAAFAAVPAYGSYLLYKKHKEKHMD